MLQTTPTIHADSRPANEAQNFPPKNVERHVIQHGRSVEADDEFAYANNDLAFYFRHPSLSD